MIKSQKPQKNLQKKNHQKINKKINKKQINKQLKSANRKISQKRNNLNKKQIKLIKYHQSNQFQLPLIYFLQRTFSQIDFNVKQILVIFSMKLLFNYFKTLFKKSFQQYLQIKYKSLFKFYDQLQQIYLIHQQNYSNLIYYFLILVLQIKNYKKSKFQLYKIFSSIIID
ncbi:hypothetical protein TTHERM_000476531 (macronuclear) [Tetrahymena thermophila SB210]|uniref:Uncharacterized protein n=1 Tax=Tetrahymena thermophila (strain SB210) TaxID=312017 RepID=W7XJD0_TETTS|nr:hypothetical protein TTHERM_000476531 [Tetrahymena thermophila SB210]EWS74049.1 hypothetical protein TTHERM_000476531 [Tetrahymena thermophila SB210]|eukprot:XP_012653382.1 hypothetical protein TTHERM_000476531 [Tetrahymena thermophila SB210]